MTPSPPPLSRGEEKREWMQVKARERLCSADRQGSGCRGHPPCTPTGHPGLGGRAGTNCALHTLAELSGTGFLLVPVGLPRHNRQSCSEWPGFSPNSTPLLTPTTTFHRNYNLSRNERVRFAKFPFLACPCLANLLLPVSVQ